MNTMALFTLYISKHAASTRISISGVISNIANSDVIQDNPINPIISNDESKIINLIFVENTFSI